MSEPVAAPAKWRNPHGLLPTLRWAVQGAYLLFFVVVGIEFHSFYRQAVSGGPVTAHRPPAVEGFLPISALFFTTGAGWYAYTTRCTRRA